MSVKNRVKEFVKNQNMTVSEFEKSISASNGYVNNITKSIGLDKLKLIIENYPILNVEWLLAGNGQMLKKVGRGECTVKDNSLVYGKLNIDRVPLILVDAVAGFAK